MHRYQPAMVNIPDMPGPHSTPHKESVTDTKQRADEFKPFENQEAESELNHQTDANAVPTSKTSTCVEIKVQSLTAQFCLNLPDESIIPVHYLKRAGHTAILGRTVWCFQKADDARNVKLRRWSIVDDHCRGFFMTLRKLPDFEPLYEEDEDNDEYEDEADEMSPTPKTDKIFKVQGQVMYALLSGILRSVEIARDADDHGSYYTIQARLLNGLIEYWTGYNERYRDGPLTAGLLNLEHRPGKKISATILPISASLEDTTLKSALEGKFKLMLGQLLLNISCLRPIGDQFPDQEVYLMGLHGSRMHIFRAIFPGQNTSRLWCGRYNRPLSEDEILEETLSSTGAHLYSGKAVEQAVQQAERSTLKSGDSDPDPRLFQVLGSREYDLWIKDDFRAAIRMIVGLFMYMMSGNARCGVLQNAFKNCPQNELKDEKQSAEIPYEREGTDEDGLTDMEQLVNRMKEAGQTADQEAANLAKWLRTSVERLRARGWCKRKRDRQQRVKESRQL